MKTITPTHMPLVSLQRGAALIVSMLILLVLTLLGITAMVITSLEERMSGNLRDKNLAFQAAEVALHAGELAVISGLSADSQATFGCTAAVTCPPLAADLTANSSVWATAQTFDETLSSVRSQPKYLVEVLTPTAISLMGLPAMIAGASAQPGTPQCYYRITALGYGGTNTATAILQSTYTHPTVKGTCHG